MRAVLSPFALALVVVAGCFGGPGPPLPDASAAPSSHYGEVSLPRLPAPAIDFTAAIDADHEQLAGGHERRDLHTGAHGLELVAFNPLTRTQDNADPLIQASGHSGLNRWQDVLCIAHWAGAGGATIVDIADPTNPTVFASIPTGMTTGECVFTDDGQYLLVSAYIGAAPGLPGVPPPIGTLGAEGVLVYDVRDKTQPEFLFHDRQGNMESYDSLSLAAQGYHAMSVAQIHGTHYVFQSFTGHILALRPGAASLEPVARLDKAGHDNWVGRHPVTGEWVLVTPFGCNVAVYGVENPADPVELGKWGAEDRSCGGHRQFPLLNTVDGRAYLVVAGEILEGVTGPYTVIDWTDPGDMFTVGTWELPGRPTASQPWFYTFSPHEFETWQGHVVTANYHAGVWVFDIGSPDRAASPVTLGYYLPHEDPLQHGGTTNKPFAFAPDTWSALFDDRGYIYTADWSTGLYVLRFGATRDA